MVGGKTSPKDEKNVLHFFKDDYYFKRSLLENINLNKTNFFTYLKTVVLARGCFFPKGDFIEAEVFLNILVQIRSDVVE